MAIIKKNSEKILSDILIRLLQGFLFHEDKKYWDKLILHQDYVRNYFMPLGVYLHLSQEDGYAFLKSSPSTSDRIELSDSEEDMASDLGDDTEQDGENKGPRSLIRKMQLPFDVSLLLVLLRESLELFDEKVSDDSRLILKSSDIYEMLKTFYTEKNDEVQLIKKFDILIGRVLDMGFLKELRNNKNHFEVRRVLKAFFDAEKLKEIKMNMKEVLA